MSRRVTRLPWDTDDRALHTHCAMLFDAVETSETLITEHCTLCGAVHWTVGISAFCKCVISLCMISSVIFYATMSGNALTEAIFSSCAKTCVCVAASRVYCIVSIGRNLIRPKIAPLRHLSLVHYCVSPCSSLSSQGHLAGANWVLAASLYWGFTLQSYCSSEQHQHQMSIPQWLSFDW